MVRLGEDDTGGRRFYLKGFVRSYPVPSIGCSALTDMHLSPSLTVCFLPLRDEIADLRFHEYSLSTLTMNNID